MVSVSGPDTVAGSNVAMLYDTGPSGTEPVVKAVPFRSADVNVMLATPEKLVLTKVPQTVEPAVAEGLKVNTSVNSPATGVSPMDAVHKFPDVFVRVTAPGP